jgi:3-oxoacyl-[acyl-carrier-protein] synthase-3
MLLGNTVKVIQYTIYHRHKKKTIREENNLYGINILGTGSYVPELVIDNKAMSKIVDTNDEWITTRTGIKQRHFCDGEPAWYMGAMAAKKAVEAAGIDPLDIGIIIDTTVTSDYYTPAVSCMIQRELGAVNSFVFDVNAACTGFVYGIDIAKRFLQTDENLKYALVVSNEVLSKITDFKDRSTCILFGDGAAAVVIERSEKMYTSYLGTDGTGAKYLFARSFTADNPFITGEKRDFGEDFPPDNEHYIVQDGKEVYKFATKALPTAALAAAEKIGLDIHDIDYFVPHQANIRIIETAAKNLGISMDKFITNLDMHGNTSSASIPTAFDEAVRDGRIKRGDKICFVGFGAGLTLGSVIFEY